MSSPFDADDRPAAADAVPTGALVPREADDPPETIAEARAEVVRSLGRIRSSIVVLRHEVAVRTDWRTYYRARPLVFLGTAFVLGFFFGSRHRPRPVHVTRRR